MVLVHSHDVCCILGIRMMYSQAGSRRGVASAIFHRGWGVIVQMGCMIGMICMTGMDSMIGMDSMDETRPPPKSSKIDTSKS